MYGPRSYMRVGLRPMPLGHNTRSPSNELTLKLSKKNRLRYIRANEIPLYYMATMPSLNQTLQRNNRANRINAKGVRMSLKCERCFKNGLDCRLGQGPVCCYSKCTRVSRKCIINPLWWQWHHMTSLPKACPLILELSHQGRPSTTKGRGLPSPLVLSSLVF